MVFIWKPTSDLGWLQDPFQPSAHIGFSQRISSDCTAQLIFTADMQTQQQLTVGQSLLNLKSQSSVIMGIFDVHVDAVLAVPRDKAAIVRTLV